MKIEKPVSPGHCLGMLNDNMRTDVLRYVHEGVRARMDAEDAKGESRPRGRARRTSPLEMVIESIEDVLARVESTDSSAVIGRNPFYAGPYQRFQPEADYRHDIELLKSQLQALREILASLEW
jgi:hypothetical protein